ncbi:unnamed protein product [Blepharisma stoltei]|uniref:Uncharacterized protein n=1 Tax=Blepharisma stoltei TaxID=1481888 RepID=A0AAU9J636_9CILI|nr:unnamed protein product [Blepharisma stoltei]
MLLNLLRLKSLKQVYRSALNFKSFHKVVYGRFYSVILETENQGDLSNKKEALNENKEDQNAEPWIGGKTPKGLLVPQGNYIKVMHAGKLITKINTTLHESNKKATEYAQKMLYDYLTMKNLVLNQYRHKSDSRGDYLEVKAGEISFICDPEDLKLIENYTWMHSIKSKLIFSNEKKISFIEHKIGLDPERFDISFNNGDLYDYRKRNLAVKLKEKIKKVKRVGKLRIIDADEEKFMFEFPENRELEEEQL